jgi:hypothetical protein
MPISFNGTTGAVTGIVSASSSDISTTLVAKTGTTGTVNLSTATVTGAGLDLITTQTLTASSSVSINNCFTSSYNNYLIKWDLTASAGAQEFQARLRSSGTDYTSANYYYQGTYSYGTTTSTSRSVTQTKFRIGSIANVSRNAGDIELYSPALSTDKQFISRCIGNADGTSNLQFDNIAGGIVASQGYDGITIYPASGTITGTIRIYGYRNTP